MVRPDGGTFLESAVTDSTNLHNALSLKRVPIGQGSSGDGASMGKRKRGGASGEEETPAVVDMNALNATSAAVLFSDGQIRIYETNSEALSASLAAWEAMHGPDSPEENWSLARLEVGVGLGGNPDENHARVIPIDKDGKFIDQRAADQVGKPKTGLDAPKHGKEDPKNEPHVGGNTWAGGTGGSDTAGLGGRGGPYRLDKGHTVHQVSEKDKNEVSDEARAEARRIAKEGLQRRLEEIKLGKNAFGMYLEYRNRVEGEISLLRGLVDELARRAKERVWLLRQVCACGDCCLL